MGVFIYLVLSLFCGYMAFELGRYVIATGDALPIIIVSLLVLLSIYCIRQVYKAIKNKDLDILD
nr:MAG TPA: FeoB-associated Cys-rich membrane protein [Bacteriophage sp.]